MKKDRTIILYLVLFFYFNCSTLPSGTVQSQAVRNRTVSISDSLSIQVSAIRENILRIDCLPYGREPVRDIRFSININPDSTVSAAVQEFPDSVIFSTRLIRLKISKNPLRLRFSDISDRFRLQTTKLEIAESDTKMVSFQIQSGDRFFGLGQKSIPPDRSGYRFRMYNTHIGGYTKPYANMQINIPYIYSPVGYGVFFDVQFPGTFDFGKTDSTQWSFELENGPLTIYLVSAENLPELQKSYYDLTGYPPMLPKWTCGMLQSRCVYRDEQQVDSVVALYEQKKLPLDAVILDVYWFGTFDPDGPRNMGNFTWLKEHFPDPENYIQQLKKKGIKTVLISEPIINLDSDNYRLLKENNWLIKQKGRSDPYVLSPYWAGDASLFDITHPGAQKWLWSRYRHLLGNGVDGLWTDLGEPEAEIPDGQTSAGPLQSVHNLYNLYWARTIWEGFQENFPNGRLFNLTRSGYAGIQRFSTAGWSGDASKTWNALQLQVPMMVGTIISGIPYFSSDIGGFANAWDVNDVSAFSNFDGKGMRTTGELYTRWFQMGVFSPMLRPHSGENQACEPFAFDETTEAVTADYLRLRYRLIPYIYSYMHKTSLCGETLIKPLFFVFNDQNDWDQNDTYLFGNEMLIAPVVHENTSVRPVYLPHLDSTFCWIDFWTDSLYESGQEITINAPIKTIPVFIKQPAVFPLGKLKQYVDQTPDDTLTIHVYPGGTASFEVYEDDGETRGYTRGEYTLIQLKTGFKREELSLSIAPVEGYYPDMVKRRTWIMVFHLIKQYKKVRCNGKTQTPDMLRYSTANSTIQFIYTTSTRDSVYVRISGVHLTTQ